LKREEKEQIVSDLHQKIEQSKAIVLTNYRGLNVQQVNQLRQRLREEKISYHVVKNTLMKLATKGTDLEKVNDYFEGPTAVAMAYGDPISLAKVLSEFTKAQPILEIKVGVVEGRVLPPEGVRTFASMPSREVLFGQILGGIQMPGSQLAGVLLNVFQQLLGVIEARADQLSGEPKVEGSGT
jgi:large subunit ribosomal protein L10